MDFIIGDLHVGHWAYTVKKIANIKKLILTEYCGKLLNIGYYTQHFSGFEK